MVDYGICKWIMDRARNAGAVRVAAMKELYRRNLALVSERSSPNAELIKALQAHTDAMDDLRQTLNLCIDEVRSVQTYGLRLQK